MQPWAEVKERWMPKKGNGEPYTPFEEKTREIYYHLKEDPELHRQAGELCEQIIHFEQILIDRFGTTHEPGVEAEEYERPPHGLHGGRAWPVRQRVAAGTARPLQLLTETNQRSKKA